MSAQQTPTEQAASMHNSPAESKNASGSPGQRQDPVERRRLQNRLSQRNHRRKIRDRMAKLQERVIASELRAAAGVKVWDQPNTAPGLMPLYENERPPSPRPETPAPFNPPYDASADVCASCSTSMGQMPLLSPADPAPLFDGSVEFDPSTPSSSLINASPPCPPTPGTIASDVSLYFPGAYPGTAGTAMNQSGISEPLPFQPQSPSNLYYQATTGKVFKNPLPQIIQALNTSPNRPRTIVLIPQQDSPGLASSASNSQGAPGDAFAGLGSAGMSSMCLCQVPGAIPNPAAAGVGTGGYGLVCPVHKPGWLSSYQVMML
ncbi:hypothetical protein PHISP_00335 [Aspergillus sp. HF37]|nr:hypothetical protein PHISP_00335 [Aspergillus sp. HF37]